MKLYLVRHGQSVANRDKVHGSWHDDPLTEKGFTQAREAAPKLAHLTFDRIYCSDLTRARQTCEAMLPGAAPEITPLLREVNVGSLIGQSPGRLAEELGESYIRNKANAEYADYGGESYADFLRRTKRFAALLEESPCEQVIAFSHGGFIRNMLDLASGTRQNRAKFRVSNCSVSVFEYRDGVWNVVTWNG